MTIKQYDMTDDATRRKVFWLLQRVTSFSLWKHKRDAFAIFANDETRAAVKAHWRLIWEDKRYADGVIPDESQYFLEPPQTLQTSAETVTLV